MGDRRRAGEDRRRGQLERERDEDPGPERWRHEPERAHEQGAGDAVDGIPLVGVAAKRAGETWDVENLFVCDGSVLPTSIGVNSQLPVMAMATRIAWSLRDNWRTYAARA